MTVVRYNDNRIFKIQKEIFKPADCCQIKVVGRLVKKKNVRIAVQCLCKEHLNLHIRRKLRHFEIMELIRNTQFVEHKFCITLCVPTVKVSKFCFKFACFDAVFLGKILFCIKSVLFLHNLNKSWVAHKNCANNLVFIISKVVLLQHRKTLARSDVNLTL